MSSAERESPADAPLGARGPGVTPVLCVDLDGTLLATDVLSESLLELLRRRDRALLFLPLWLLQGRARLKREIARRVSLDPAGLPYNQPLLDFLRREKAGGRRIVLATASDRAVVDGIARHLGLFAEVLASDGRVNLAGRNKLDALLRHFGARRFDYVGNAAVDLAIWREANAAIVVTSSRRLLARVRDVVEVRQVFPIPPRSSRTSLFEALRLRLKARR